VKWDLPLESFATEAREMMQDLQVNAVELCAPDLLHAEIVNVFWRAERQGRVTEAEAVAGIQRLLATGIVLYPVASLALRAFQMAHAHNRSAYDCLYIALAEQEGIEFWTGDERLFNAISPVFPFVRFIRDYAAQRPQP
jgi:predicted nucleic acid-binding protein